MIFFIAFSLLHITFIAWVYIQWTMIRPLGEVSNDQNTTSFSVLIPIRNEAQNILSLLTDLQTQTFPNDHYEVIIINDHSEDESLKLCEEFSENSPMKIQIIDLQEVTGKKAAITRGVNNAQYEIIICTDGDCSVGKDWLKSFAKSYRLQPSVMITGPVSMDGNSFFSNIQAYEFHTLISIGAASLSAGFPGMCNGANLSYRKEAFLAVGGYEGNNHIPSGDDEFLLQKLFRKFPDQIHFLKSYHAVVFTNAKSSLPELISQRIRWSSKWKFHKSVFIKGMAILVFLDYGVFITFLFLSLIGKVSLSLFLMVLFFRWMSVYLLNLKLEAFLPLKNRFLAAIVGEIIYPFFVIFLGLASIFGKYSWKGRQYK